MLLLRAGGADQKTKFESYKTRAFSVPVLYFNLYSYETYLGFYPFKIGVSVSSEEANFAIQESTC